MTITKTASGGTMRHPDHRARRWDNDDSMQHRFEALLQPEAAHAGGDPGDTPRPDDDGRRRASLLASPAVRTASSHMAAPLDIGTLNLRLTNGPFTGLEIEASATRDQLHVRVKVDDVRRFERAMNGRRELESELAARFNCLVTLEIRLATHASR